MMDKKYNLTNLKNMIGENDEAIKNFVQLFIQTSTQQSDEISSALDVQDYETVGAIAHKLKSSINLLGIKELENDIKVIEKSAKELINTHELPALILKMKRVLKVVNEQLKLDILNE